MPSFAPTSLCLYGENPADTSIVLLSRALPAPTEIKILQGKDLPVLQIAQVSLHDSRCLAPLQLAWDPWKGRLDLPFYWPCFIPLHASDVSARQLMRSPYICTSC